MRLRRSKSTDRFILAANGRNVAPLKRMQIRMRPARTPTVRCQRDYSCAREEERWERVRKQGVKSIYEGLRGNRHGDARDSGVPRDKCRRETLISGQLFRPIAARARRRNSKSRS